VKVAAAALAVLAALSCAGCGDERLAAPMAAAGSAVPERGGTLRLASIGDIRTLDPAASSDALGGMMVQLLFAGLVDFDERGAVVPDLARSFTIAPDGLAITFFLREGVRFHDGAELTADDVKRSIDRSLHPGTPNPFASFFDRIVGFDAYRAKKTQTLEGVEVGGRYVVTVRLRARDAMLLPLFALHGLRPVCASAGTRYDDAWHPCGAGPFKLEPGGWQRGRQLTLVRHGAFFRPGEPRLDAVTIFYLMASLTQRYKLEAGALDVMRDFTQGDLSRLATDERWKPFGEYEPERSIFGEAMNTEIPPFDNVEVRRAVAAAIDREQYRLIRPGTILPSGKAVPSSVPGYSKDVEGQSFDRTRALEHMRRAGYAFDPETGRGGYPHRIEYLAYRPGYAEYSAQVLQQQLAKIGLRIDIRLVSFATHLTLSQRRGKTAMSTQAWSLDYPDAHNFYESLFSSRMISDEHCSNAAFYKNAELDGMLDKAREELDPAARQAIYDRAQAIVRDDAPWAMTHANRWYVVRQPYVRDLELHPTWIYSLRRTWLDRAKGAIAARAGVFGELLGLSVPARNRTEPR
jgi:ABC-type transport system substrate-binding protein